MSYTELPGLDLIHFAIPLSNDRVWVNSGKGQRKKGWRLVPEAKQFLYGCGLYDREGWMFHKDPSQWDEWDADNLKPGMFLAVEVTWGRRMPGGLIQVGSGLLLNRADKSKAAMFKMSWL